MMAARYSTPLAHRRDVETIEARYTSESLFALMAYVWKREGSQGGGGGEVSVLSGHPYAYYAFAPCAVTARGTPACTLASCFSLLRPGYGLAIPLSPPPPALPVG